MRVSISVCPCVERGCPALFSLNLSRPEMFFCESQDMIRQFFKIILRQAKASQINEGFLLDYLSRLRLLFVFLSAVYLVS